MVLLLLVGEVRYRLSASEATLGRRVVVLLDARGRRQGEDEDEVVVADNSGCSGACVGVAGTGVLRDDGKCSNSSIVFFSHPFCTFTIAYDRRVLSCAES